MKQTAIAVTTLLVILTVLRIPPTPTHALAEASVQIVDLTSPSTVNAGQNATVAVAVKWSGLDKNSGTLKIKGSTIQLRPPLRFLLKLQADSTSLTDELAKSAGSKSYNLQVKAPRAGGPWTLTVTIGLQVKDSSGNTINFTNLDSREVSIEVTAATTATTIILPTAPRTTTTTQPPPPATVTTPTAAATLPPTTPGLTSELLVIAAVVVIVLIAAGLLYTRRKK